jgi:DNA-binding response OmpR family regulator
MRILLVEDDEDLAVALKGALQEAGFLVDVATDGIEAQALLKQDPNLYQVGILDWMLPGMSGIQLCQWLRERGIPLPIMMLTAKDQMQDKVSGLDAGADDYVVKPFDMAELLARLRALGRRPAQVMPRQWQVGSLVLDHDRYGVWVTGQVVELTRKEFQLLEYLMQHSGQVLTSEQIRQRLWEIGESPVSNIVAAQMRLLRRKLGSLGYLIETVFGVGYRLKKE